MTTSPSQEYTLHRRGCVRTGSRRATNGPAHDWGFTLIEMLVVFTLIAMLLTIAVPRYLNAVDGSKFKAREQNLATLRDALDKFKADQGQYPSSLEDLIGKHYLRALPVDPVTGSTLWISVADPSGVSAGVYDVMPPTQPTPASGSSDNVSAQEMAQPASAAGPTPAALIAPNSKDVGAVAQ